MTPKQSNQGPGQREELLETLKARFEQNMNRHEGLQWTEVRARLEAQPDSLWSLSEMERTGGEPDVVGEDNKTGEYLFYDCSSESPRGRRSVCYDRQALEARKKHKPDNSAVEMATAMGAGLQTPPDIRRLGGAIFGDFRYGTVFVYHNGAESYYAARGFRCSLRV